MGKDIIICVDDEIIILLSLRLDLQKYLPQYTIEISQNPESVVPLIKSFIQIGYNPVLVITDFCMPGLNGPELAGLIKENFKDIKVLMISAYNNMFEEIKKLKEELKIDSFLSKPFEAADLIDTIRGILEKKRDNNII